MTLLPSYNLKIKDYMALLLSYYLKKQITLISNKYTNPKSKFDN